MIHRVDFEALLVEIRDGKTDDRRMHEIAFVLWEDCRKLREFIRDSLEDTTKLST